MTSRWLKFIFFLIFFYSRKSFQRQTRNQRNLLNDLPPCGTIFSFDFWNLMIPIIQSIVIFMFPFIPSQIELILFSWFFLFISCLLIRLTNTILSAAANICRFNSIIFQSWRVLIFFIHQFKEESNWSNRSITAARLKCRDVFFNIIFKNWRIFLFFFKKKRGETNISRKFLPPFTHWKVLENFVHAWLKFYYFSKQVAGATCFQPTAYVAAPNSRNILSPFDNKSVGSN